ncbi:MAG: alpha/beta hydrolase [Myxococcota bacterium]
MPVVDTPRGSLNVVTLGDGPPLLLLHGLFVGSAAQWYFTSAPALAASHRVVMVDLPSHGRSARRASGYTLDVLVQDLRIVVEAMGLEPLSMAGHSYGGLVALAYAARHPLERLALVDVPLPGQPAGEALSSPEALMDAMPGPVREALDNGGRRARKLLESVAYLATETTLIEDMKREKPFSVEGITVPTLLVYGVDSGCRPSRDVLRDSLPNLAGVVDLPGGHFLPAESPVELTEALVGWFAGDGAPGA